MSLKFLSRLRDKDKSPVKPRPVVSSTISAPRRGTELDIAEVQVISWEPETERNRSRSCGASRDHTAQKDLGARTPLYEAFTQSRADQAEMLQASGLAHPFSDPTGVVSVLERPRVATRREPEMLIRDYPPIASTSVDTCELLRPRKVEGAATKQATKHHGWHHAKRKADPSNASKQAPSGESGTSFYRSDTIQSVSSVVSLASTLDGTEAKGQGHRKGSFGFSKKPSLQFFRRAKHTTGSGVESPEDPDGLRTQSAGRTRSSSMTSLSSTVLQHRSKEKPPSVPSVPHNVLPGGSSGRNAGGDHAPSSWRSSNGAVASASDTSPYLSSGYSSEVELSATRDTSGPKSRAKSAIARARSIKKGSVPPAAALQSRGVSEAVAASPPMPKGFDVVPSPKLSDTYTEQAVKVSSPGIPTVALPLPSSPGRPQKDSMNGLLATKLFQQLGPPPTGLSPSAFEQRVAIVMEYIDSRSITNTVAESIQAVQAPSGHRTSLPPSKKVPNPVLHRGKSVASTEDEFDKVECQMEQEMLRLLARGACDRTCVEDLRLDAVFLEARRRCGVGHSRTHFQLFEVGTSTSSPLLSPDGRGWADAASLGTSPRSLASGNGGVQVTDTLTGLGIPLRPAPRRKKRPTTAPETQSALLGGGGGAIPPSPHLRLGGAGTLSARPRTARLQRSPAPSLHSMHTSEESHDVGSREGYGLGFDVTRSAVLADDAEGRAPIVLFTPQSFSTTKTPSYSVQDAYAAKAAPTQICRPSALAQAMASSPPPPPLHFSNSPSHYYRRGSSDRESGSSHTTRSVRSPATTYGRLSSRFSAGTRNSQDTNDTTETSESTLAGGAIGGILFADQAPPSLMDQEPLKVRV